MDRRLAGNLAVDLGLDLALTHALAVSLTITSDIFYQRFSALSLALDLETSAYRSTVFTKIATKPKKPATIAQVKVEMFSKYGGKLMAKLGLENCEI